MQDSVAKLQAPGEPAWEIARLFPLQGAWSVEEYLALETNRLVEFCDGRVEVLELPTEFHQLIVAFLYGAVLDFTRPTDLGTVLFAPFPVGLWERKFREPDVLFMLRGHDSRRGKRRWDGADLVMEVVSDDDPERDLVIKRDEYARAGIPEYWIVDPRDETITVLTLPASGQPYVEAGVYRRGERAESVLLAGLAVDVDAVFSQR